MQQEANGGLLSFLVRGGKPVVSSRQSVFHTSAVASGLVDKEDVQQAMEELRASEESGGSPEDGPTDEALANKLVEMGRLNRWQSTQLLRGRSKFNLGPYRIIDAIGQGGMGQVFKAEHTVMRRIVAIKVLPRDRTSVSSIGNFNREVRTQAQLDHENLVRAYDAGQDGNVHFLVTEFVPGTDLRRLVRTNGRLSMEAASVVIAQAARGLGYAHSKGLIHRDVKPGNVLVTPDGRTKVSDLGLAAWFSADSESDPRRGKIVGTADYLSPEQIRSPDQITPLSDIYSLGCTLYYAVTGKVAFPGGSIRDKVKAHCNLRPLDPRRLNPDLEDAFVDVIAEMMEKEPQQRMQSAHLVLERLANWVPRDWAEALHFAVAPLQEGAAVSPITQDPGAMADTEPMFPMAAEVDDDPAESPSQASDYTVPASDDSEETVHSAELGPNTLYRSTRRGLPLWLQTAIIALSVAALLLLSAMLVR